MNSPPLLLLQQSLPPISPTENLIQLKTPLPVHNSIPGARTPVSSSSSSLSYIRACAGKTTRRVGRGRRETQMTTMPLSPLSTPKAASLGNPSARFLANVWKIVCGFGSNYVSLKFVFQNLVCMIEMHYMLDSEINEQLTAAANVGEGDVVLEIGPGTGSLTNVLISAGAFVLAIEKDPHMATLVSERFSETERFKVLKEDFVKCHLHSHMSSLLASREPSSADSRYAKVVANIPFNISTDVVKQLLPMGDIFSEVVLLLQEETALRLVESSLRTSEYRPINIFVNFYSDPQFICKVPRTKFFPQPNVDAAVVKFKLKQPAHYPSVSSTKSFFSMVNSAFNGKRKMLRRSLQHIGTPMEIENALGNVGCPATSRPEELSMDDFVKLHNLIVKV
ncbi:ribosomal RNA small subunit methyltransferase chloroplastic isoform X1 [Prunus yedoensis var. nudiflora]|uniref:rRNA adenine N(6)-methyltransferase n=1 Tax=Prunus yedoensis var. nudiflora TaxID=2094558 RepID=A0A314UHG8_PRUYE|nr:ribosomal RNA small subunit methyltransferase chloroplastic isoform X1 [Prunus yedoensis var. nudiflora]